MLIHECFMDPCLGFPKMSLHGQLLDKHFKPSEPRYHFAQTPCPVAIGSPITIGTDRSTRR